VIPRCRWLCSSCRRHRQDRGNIIDQEKPGQNNPKNANDHEHWARVHPAQPSYSWSSQRRSFLSVDVAVITDIGMPKPFRKGWLVPAFSLIGHFPDYRPPRSRRRGRHLGRLLDSGLGRGLSELPDRPIDNRNHQHNRRDNGA
jgi:hypothetical protein